MLLFDDNSKTRVSDNLTNKTQKFNSAFKIHFLKVRFRCFVSGRAENVARLSSLRRSFYRSRSRLVARRLNMGILVLILLLQCF